MTASTGTFSYWRYGQLPPELEVSTTTLAAGADLSVSVAGAGALVPSVTAGGYALAGTLDGTGAVGDLLTAGSALLGSTLDGRGALVPNLAVGSILGRTPSVSIRYGLLSDFTAPRSGDTGTFAYWRNGMTTEFRAQAGPLSTPSGGGLRRRLGRFGLAIFARLRL